MSTDTNDLSVHASGVEITGLRKSYGSNEVLKGIDLNVAPGEVVCLIGPSGSGKSTLLRCVNLLEQPNGGTIMVGGFNATDPEVNLDKMRQQVGMVFQQFNLFHSRDVAGNVAYPLKVAGWKKSDRDARVAELLEFVGLSEKAEQHPEQLSGGQKQRVGIARALAAKPDILLADESTSALDPKTTAEVLQLLRRANEELGITIVAITHEMEVIRSIADRVAVMDQGRIVETGLVYDVFSSPRETKDASFVGAALKNRPSVEDVEWIRRHSSGRLIIVSLQNAGAVSSVLGEAATHGVSFEIVHGGMSTTKNASYGLLTLTVDGKSDAVTAFVTALNAAGEVQEVHA